MLFSGFFERELLNTVLGMHKRMFPVSGVGVPKQEKGDYLSIADWGEREVDIHPSRLKVCMNQGP